MMNWFVMCLWTCACVNSSIEILHQQLTLDQNHSLVKNITKKTTTIIQWNGTKIWLIYGINSLSYHFLWMQVYVSAVVGKTSLEFKSKQFQCCAMALKCPNKSVLIAIQWKINVWRNFCKINEISISNRIDYSLIITEAMYFLYVFDIGILAVEISASTSSISKNENDRENR